MSNIVQEILENAAMTANMTVLYNVFVGKPTETATVENINQAVSMLSVNNKFTKEDIKDDIMNAQAIAMVVNKQNKKTIGFGMIRKPNLEKKIQIFKDADNEELSSEYIFELDNIVVDREHRGKGVGEYIIQRLIGLRTGRGTTIYCSTNSQDISRVLKVKCRFENLKDNDEQPFLLGVM
tara:strand:+ start:207 stop:746 length:540 start_codon:yes stop_codon:yes gene_type:complete